MVDQLPSGAAASGKQSGDLLIDDNGWLEGMEALCVTRPKTKDGSAFTYVVCASGYGVKVGHSKRPKGRLSEMQVGCPVPMWLGHTWRLAPEGAKQLERQLHRMFAWASTHGEWFDVLAGEIIAVGELLVAGRLDDARRLGAIHQERRAMDLRLDRLRRAWYFASGSMRARAKVEADAKLLLPAAERESARLDLEAYELGYWPHGPTHTIGGRNALARLRAEAA